MARPVVFTTAFEGYAIRAFEVHAVDYLLKPINRERLAECVAYLDKTPPQAQRAQIDEARRQHRLERILIRRGPRLVVIGVNDVAVFESENKLVFARTAEGRFPVSLSMKEIEDRVDRESFCRVHKQAILRLSLVREIHALPGGQYVAKLCDGSEVQVGKKFTPTNSVPASASCPGGSPLLASRCVGFVQDMQPFGLRFCTPEACRRLARISHKV